MSRLDKLTRILAVEPNDAFTLYAIAQEHMKQRSWQAAVDFFDRSLACDPNSCYAYYHKAVAQRALGLTDAAHSTIVKGCAVAAAASDQKALGELQSLMTT